MTESCILHSKPKPELEKQVSEYSFGDKVKELSEKLSLLSEL